MAGLHVLVVGNNIPFYTCLTHRSPVYIISFLIIMSGACLISLTNGHTLWNTATVSICTVLKSGCNWWPASCPLWFFLLLNWYYLLNRFMVYIFRAVSYRPSSLIKCYINYLNCRSVWKNKITSNSNQKKSNKTVTWMFARRILQE